MIPEPTPTASAPRRSTPTGRSDAQLLLDADISPGVEQHERVRDAFGHPVPSAVGDIAERFEAALPKTQREAAHEQAKLDWWKFNKTHPTILQAYKDIVDHALSSGGLVVGPDILNFPLPPDIVYSVVRKRHHHTRDYSPFYARYMNQCYRFAVFKIKKQPGEIDDVFRRLAEPLPGKEQIV